MKQICQIDGWMDSYHISGGLALGILIPIYLMKSSNIVFSTLGFSKVEKYYYYYFFEIELMLCSYSGSIIFRSLEFLKISNGLTMTM